MLTDLLLEIFQYGDKPTMVSMLLCSKATLEIFYKSLKNKKIDSKVDHIWWLTTHTPYFPLTHVTKGVRDTPNSRLSITTPRQFAETLIIMLNIKKLITVKTLIGETFYFVLDSSISIIDLKVKFLEKLKKDNINIKQLRFIAKSNGSQIILKNSESISCVDSKNYGSNIYVIITC